MAGRTEGTAPTWKQGAVTSWLTTVDHKRIGILYIVTSFLFFFAGGVMAILMRLQLAQADQHLIEKNSYNELFTIHGTTMIFLFAVPLFAGFANYLIPLMIGARDMAFPRLNALSYWLFLLGGLVVLASFLVEGGAANSGWTAYTPLSGSNYSPSLGQDMWILGIHLTSLGSLAGAINFIVTIHNMRTRGMTWMRIPIFVWTIEAYSVLLVLALPTISAAATLLLLDRQAGTSFFEPAEGGSQILWQHMFWFFGHPEVYIMVLPAMGMLSEVIPVFSRKPIFGYKAVAFSTIGIAFASMLVWAHHMFTVGLPTWLLAFFLVSSFSVAVPDLDQALQLAGDAVARPSRPANAASLLSRVHRALHHRGSLRDHAGRLPDRLPGAGFLLPRRAPPLRALRRLRLRDLRGDVLLVPEDHGADVRRAAREGALLAAPDRLQHGLSAPALPRPHGHAAADLHL